MSGHLCLKWNNHSLAFLKSISAIQIKEKYCDATIACQGRYFPVHRVILSTCSDYFGEIFDRMESPHPYIVFKDIDPDEMELLLNYMYQGEVNVIQERLPSLIKAAEAMKVKGLAIPDDAPAEAESHSTRKRKANSMDNPEAKRRSEESTSSRKSKRNSQTRETDVPVVEDRKSSEDRLETCIVGTTETQPIKEEPVDLEPSEFESSLKIGLIEASAEEGRESFHTEEIYLNKPEDETPYIKAEDPSTSSESFENQTAWPDYSNSGSNLLPGIPAPEITTDDISETAGTSDQDEEATFGHTSSLTTSPEYKCPHCPYRSHYSFGIARHVECKHVQERPYACPSCSLRFSRKHHLKNHLMIHTGLKPWECFQCGKKFTEKSSLTRHFKRKISCQKFA